MINLISAASFGIGEIVLIIACAVIVLSGIITAIVRKVRGKSMCGGDCGCCKDCSHCKSNLPNNENK